jgi:hypothetical protein
MPARHPADAQSAIQYLTWALEEIESFGHRKAARHTGKALEEMRSVLRSADKPDELAT